MAMVSGLSSANENHSLTCLKAIDGFGAPKGVTEIASHTEKSQKGRAIMRQGTLKARYRIWMRCGVMHLTFIGLPSSRVGRFNWLCVPSSASVAWVSCFELGLRRKESLIEKYSFEHASPWIQLSTGFMSKIVLRREFSWLWISYN